MVEGKAVIACWSAWAPVEMRFARKDDAIEPLHPVMDGRLLGLLEGRTFGKREYFETPGRECAA